MEEKNEQQDLDNREVCVWKVVVAVVACFVLLLSLTVVVWWSIIGVRSFDEGMQAVGNLFGVTQSADPSQSDEAEKVFKNREQVVATMGDTTLTNGQLQIYYWTGVVDFLKDNSDYIPYLGLDVTKPLNEQECYMDAYATWQDYFLQCALDDWHKYQSMALEAEKEGMKLPEDLQKVLDNLRTTTETSAKANGYNSVDAFVQADYGPGCNFEDYAAYMQVYFTGYAYFNKSIKETEISDQTLNAYYDANAEELKKQGFEKIDDKVYGVRHILIEVVGTGTEDGKTVITDDDWETCRQKAQDLLDKWLAGEHTESTFAEFANSHSTDPGSNTKGGLYSGLDKNTNFVEPFKNWYLDENRKVGDYGLVKSSYGYHIMYQSTIQVKWKAECEYRMYEEAATKILDDSTKAHPIVIQQSKVMIGAPDYSK